MDAEVPQLGPGIEPADRPVRREDHQLPVGIKSGNGSILKLTVPTLFHRHLYYCQKIPALFRRPGVGSAHKKAIDTMPYFDAKKYINLCKILSDGYTKNEINNSTTSYYKKQQQNLTYLIHIKGISFSKDTKFFTPSFFASGDRFFFL